MNRESRSFKVATFYHPDEGPLRISRIQCYTLWYNPTWKGCMVFDVEAVSGAEAKKLARLARFEHEDKMRNDFSDDMGDIQE